MQNGHLTAGPYNSTPRRFGLERNEPELAEKLKQLALACWNLFGLSGYARFDFRVDPAGKPFVIDVNPNPFLAPDASYPILVASAGFSPAILPPSCPVRNRRRRPERGACGMRVRAGR